MIFKKGIYKHFKGHKYRVIGIAKNSENLEEMVVYVDMNDENNIWVRPLAMFFEKVTRDGKTFDRFEFIEELN